MSTKLWLRVAGVSGATSVAAAAYGAHGLSNDQFKMVYANGNKLHMAHSCAILAGASAAKSMRAPSVTLALFSLGVFTFSGSCYAAALSKNRENGKLAPIGGTALILAWASLIL
mmetsp:Transcript_1189/g.1456  ORF Transcript_1189/g.1456 Transcript_1189/m.1456 type:complete len:114 (-) Transcript_1189:93-434(-)|eukprot:CAMPEP_0185752668 /NCGR_PEP_ID=MMETSP1174-20130828/11458_1 /TAXON_ID=35687 /ORGANISM="Dictyocha speculum, Strain CCMP1381" /LENGTH=113 /DNA_ID=CAMNT_0028430215 /DNA_START=48 /DNA_END=389 /DNA_ORIENTATION=+